MSGENILVVDDRREIRDFIVDMVLKPNGFRAMTARDGVDALEKVRKHHPDLMLLDLQMPRMNGFDVLSTLNREGLDIPVILMTAHGSEAIAVEVFRLGVRDYIIKGEDFNPDDFLRAIDRSLTEVRLRREKERLYEDLLIANADLNRRLRELNVLYHVGRSVTALMDISGLMQRVVGAATILTSSEEGALYLLEDGQLICRALKRRSDERPVSIRSPMQDSLAAQSIATSSLVMHDHPVNGHRAAIASPLVLGKQSVGALVVRNVSPDTDAFTDHDGALLSALADYAAMAYKTTQGQLVQDSAALQPTLSSRSIFVSYRRSDFDDYVQPMVDMLTAQGMRVWIDQSLLEGGQDWLDKIGQALDECSVMVLCVSPEALQSRYVRLEYRYYIHQEKPIIPVICREARLPAELVGIQSLRFDENEKLVERLRLILERPTGQRA